MLQTFSTNVGCDYRFVNNGENAGMVYGEIMHTILRPALKNVSIEVQNGTIYDWRTNTWTSLCYESSIDSEVLKTYNIKCESGSQLRVTVRGITFENDKYEEIVQEVNCEETNTEPLYKYMFRQHTLELLSQCRTSSSISRIAQKACKKELKEFFKKMRQFMRRQNLTTDPFMYLLCEDIITAYKTIGTDLGNMYCTSRQSSQGRESSYSERYDEDTQVHPYATPLRNNKKNIGNIPPPPKLRRQINNSPLVLFQSNFENIMGDIAEESNTGTDPFDIPTITLLNQQSVLPHQPLELTRPHRRQEELVNDEDDIENYIDQTKTEDTSNLNKTYSTPSRTRLMTQLSSPIIGIDDSI
jgi:hypothetical protein